MDCHECSEEAVYLILKGKRRNDMLCEECIHSWMEEELEDKYRQLEG